MFLRFVKTGKNWTAVYSGTKRVGTIEGKFIRCKAGYFDAIATHVACMNGAIRVQQEA